MEYEYIKLTKSDLNFLLPLMLDCFGDNVDIQYFKWKFYDNPSGEVVGYYAKEIESGEIAAYYGVIPETYVVDGEIKLIYQSCDTMTHSNHRGRGLFKKLAFMCYDELMRYDCLFVIGFSGEMSTPGFLKFGWKHVFNMKYYFIPSFLGFSKSDDSNIEEINDFSKISHLLNSKNHTNIYSLKNESIYTWRTSNPKFEYKTIVTNNNKIIDSYLTYSIYGDKILILDYSYSNFKSLKKLFQYLLAKTKEFKLKGVFSYVQENSIVEKEVKKLGLISNPFSFGPMSQKGPFIFYSAENVMNKYLNGDSWQITAFDYDAM